MAKLKLQPDELRVESFQVAHDGPASVGTVLANIKQEPAQPATIEPCILPSNTCGVSCYGTCGGSCPQSCNATCVGTCAGYNTCGQSCSPLARCIPPAYPPQEL